MLLKRRRLGCVKHASDHKHRGCEFTQPTHCFLTRVYSVCLSVSPALDLCHERASRVALAGVLAAVVVPGADHLVVDDHVDALPTVPPLALAVLYHRHVHHLKKGRKKSLVFQQEGNGMAL